MSRNSMRLTGGQGHPSLKVWDVFYVLWFFKALDILKSIVGLYFSFTDINTEHSISCFEICIHCADRVRLSDICAAFHSCHSCAENTPDLLLSSRPAGAVLKFQLLGTLRQKVHRFKASLGSRVSSRLASAI